VSAAAPEDGDVRRSGSPEATEALGAALGAALARGDLVLLSGPLGAGKTRFVKGLARGIGSGARVRSPSFTLVHEYSGPCPLLHLDLYRLERAEALELGLDELLERGAVVVEWGERFPESITPEALELELSIAGEHARSLAARARGERGLELLSAWRAIEQARSG
jgi:tRNA threonylcarbamoyladenosine biosynthesis protein TsaE